MDVTEKFNGLASVYEAGRPSYANAFIDDLFQKYGVSSDSVIADIGSGTGKFSEQLLKRGIRVYCIEPNEDMRGQSTQVLRKYANCSILAGNATDTALSDSSVNFITAAQSFHWFDTKQFKKECQRIIRMNGKVFLIWNIVQSSDIIQKNHEINRKYCPNSTKDAFYKIKKDDIRICEFFDHSYERLEYDHLLCYNRDKFINRNLSSSHSLKIGEENFEEYKQTLEQLFEEHAENGILYVPNKTVVYMGVVKK